MTSPRQDTRDGLVVGLVAYASVAVFYILFDMFAARGQFYTVNLLGRAAFRGLRDPVILQYPQQLDWVAIFLYNGVHLILSLLIGFIVLRFVGHAERRPPRAGFMVFLIVAGFVVTILGVGWLSRHIRAVLPYWSIVTANSAAVVVGGLYLIRRRPGIVGRLLPLGR